MKRISTLFIAAAMLCGASSVAEAADIKVNGFWQISGVYQDSLGLVNNEAADAKGLSNVNDFDVMQRIYMAMNITNSENLKSHISVYVPQNGTWGTGPLAAGGSTLPVSLVNAYIDWFIPTTEIMIRMGMQADLNPNYMGMITSPVFYNSAPGIAVFMPINDNITLEAQWLRLHDTSSTVSSTNYTSINAEYFTLGMPMHYDSWQIHPWISYAVKQDDIDGPVNVLHMNGLGKNTYWLGFTSEFRMFDPFTW